MSYWLVVALSFGTALFLMGLFVLFHRLWRDRRRPGFWLMLGAVFAINFIGILVLETAIYWWEKP